ncbi:MAG: hypothetical protein IT289_13225 [Oligoflexia bacterium]|nr:hypothetical protein [Oligoflexia bacterium]
MDLYSALDLVNNGGPVDYSAIERGHSFIKNCIDDRSFLTEFCDGWGHSYRKGGSISGDFLPLTVNVLNIDESPAKQVYFGDSVWIVVYYGISPELENFVTIVLWPSRSQTSKTTYQQVLNTISGKNRVVTFQGKYSLMPPNEIHPSWVDKIDVVEQESSFYEWKFYPFIKVVGDDLLFRGSPSNYRKIFLRNNRSEIEEEYVNVKSIIGLVLDKRSDQVLIKVPHLTNESRRPFWFSIYDVNINKKIEIGKLYYFLILQTPLAENSLLIEMRDAGPHDFIAHILSYQFYRKYLESDSLFVDTYERYLHLFKEVEEVAFAVLGRNFGYDSRILSSSFILQYLQPFFKNIGETIYYIPKIISNISNSEVESFDKLLSSLSSYNPPSKNKPNKAVVENKSWKRHNTVRFLKGMKRFLLTREIRY